MAKEAPPEDGEPADAGTAGASNSPTAAEAEAPKSDAEETPPKTSDDA